MNKVLKFMGMTYTQLYSRDIEMGNSIVRKYLYREKTNVFAYYIIKTVLLYFHVQFMNWCDIHNGLLLIKFRQTRLNLMEIGCFHLNSCEFV